MKRLLLFTLLSAFLFSNSFAQTPGSLDLGFNGSGLKSFTLKTNASDDEVGASVTDAQGNLYIAGAEKDEDGNYAPFVLKVLPTGKLDLTFGIKGKADLSFLLDNMIPEAIALQSNKKIVLAGRRKEGNPFVMRLTASGFQDQTFNVDKGVGLGYIFFEGVGTDFGPTLNAIQIAANGTIYASGGTGSIESADANILLVALDSSGIAKPDFGTGGLGIVTVMFDATVEAGAAMILDDTVVYVAGTGLEGNKVNFVLVAIHAVTGDPIPSFGGGLGKIKLPVRPGIYKDFCTSMQLTSDHKLILAGHTSNVDLNTTEMLVYKVDHTGSTNTDVNFPFSGKLFPNTAPIKEVRVLSLSLDSGDKPVISGIESITGSNYTWFISRLLANGTYDTGGFGDAATPGTRRFSLPVRYTNPRPVINIAPIAGGYLLTGSIQYSDGSQDIKVRKIDVLGKDINAYGANNNAEATFWTRDENCLIKDMAIRSDGKMVVAGDIILGAKTLAAVAVLNSNGSLDESFGGTNGAIPGVTYLPAGLDEPFVYALELLPSDKIVLAGCHNGPSNRDIFVAQLNKDGSKDSVNFGSPGFSLFERGQGDDWAHDLLIQPDGRILVYGYLHEDGQEGATVVRFNKDGTLDANFGMGNTPPYSGYFTYMGVSTRLGVEQDRIEIKLQPGDDHKIVGVSSVLGGDGNRDFLIFRLDSAGVLDPLFGPTGEGKNIYQVANPHDDYASCLTIKADGKILVGGTSTPPGAGSDGDYTLIQLTKDGLDDVIAAGVPWNTRINRGSSSERINNLYLENNNTIVAIGDRKDPDTGKSQYTALRFNANTAALDQTFAGRGHTILTEGYVQNGRLLGATLYLAGTSNDLSAAPFFAQVARIKLGTGPLIKNTILALPNLAKTYGDAPFRMTAVTNSPGAIMYSIVPNGTTACASIDATGLITILCATTGSGNHIVIKATQAQTDGYTPATATATIEIERANPLLIFTSQGGIVGQRIRLKYTTGSDALGSAINFQKITSNGVAVQVYSDSLLITGAGEEQVRITVFPTTNYKEATATATIYGSTAPQSPETNDDNAELIYGEATSVNINVLGNDGAVSGFLGAKYLDLDPGTPGIQDTYISPSLGLFKVDTTTSLVVYIPFSGFIGSGAIPYRVTDNQGSSSGISYIHVTVTAKGETPDLEATEMITPNNDGKNEAFVIAYMQLGKDNILKIFDRNGQELFTQTNYDNDWRGELSNGKQVENGVYYYVFVENNSGKKRELKGAIEVRR